MLWAATLKLGPSGSCAVEAELQAELEFQFELKAKLEGKLGAELKAQPMAEALPLAVVRGLQSLRLDARQQRFLGC